MKEFDVLIIGAGGAGMMCAIEAGKRGRRVALLDHSAKLGAKILISGGGRCNFTNLGASPANYVSQNPHFCKSALSRFSPQDFLRLVQEHRIPYHEKKLGQQFCDHSATDIVSMLEVECRKAKAQFFLDKKVTKIEKKDGGFLVMAASDAFSATSLVIATGGLSIPKIGASGFGYQIARQFGLKIVETAAALDGFKFGPEDLKKFGDLTGVSCDSSVACNGTIFRENILFTHAGLSGPAALQASLYWHPGEAIEINFLPGFEAENLERKLKQACSKRHPDGLTQAKTFLGLILPKRLAERLCGLLLGEKKGVGPLSEDSVSDLAQGLQGFEFFPASTVGYSKAEVTRGGVDTDELSSKTMETKKVPGLYFIGEVVDVTGWLGGYNFQWAWASGFAAGQAV